MTKPIKFAALCSLSVLLGACGGDRSADLQATVASRISASTQSQPASAYATVVQHIYVGYFGRPADPGGLAFFAQHLSSMGAPANIADLSIAYDVPANSELRALIDGFGNSVESQALYAGDNGVFIEAVYRNLFSRPADAAGKAYWINAINSGAMTRASAAVQIMAGAKTTDRDVIDKKTMIAGSFTTSVNSPQRAFAYSGLEANVVVRDMLGTVTLASDTSAFQPNIDSALDTLVSRIGAQGMYAGKLTSIDKPLHSLVLEDGQYWGIYGSTSANGAFIAGAFVQGRGSSVNGVFSASDLKDFGPNPAVAGSISANYVALSSLGGAIGISGATLPFTGAPLPVAAYNYAAPAKLSDIAGSQRVEGSLGYHVMQIAGDGSFSGSHAGCSYTGKLTPRASGRNVFDASWNFGTACPLPGPTSGAAFSYAATGDAPRTLVIATTNAARTAGAMAATDGLLIGDTVEGSGAAAVAGNTLTVRYTGWLYDANAANKRGAQFDTGPYAFRLGVDSVITGWHRGLAGMKAGGKRTLIIPPALAYGTRGSGSIPPNSTLVFDVELLSIR